MPSETACSLCHGTITEFLDLGKQPLANKYPKEHEFAYEEFFPIKVFFCETCKNVQLGTFISRERMFEDYYYLSSVNSGLVRHFESFAETLRHAKFVVDVGSNDGILLKPLKKMGVRALGIDPSVNVSKIANDAGLETVTAFFDAESVQRIEREYGKPDIIVASSVFTHVEDPHQFLEDVGALLAADGEFIVEVEYIVNIIESIQFERFYLDRIFYYSLASLKNLLEKHGMHMANAELIEPHGGSLRITAKKGAQTDLPERAKRLLTEEEKKLNKEALKKFGESAQNQVQALHSKLDEYKKGGLRVSGYGAPARVATICNFGRIGPDLIRYIVDDSPLKQGRYTPGTHIPIVPAGRLTEDRPDVLVVFAHEYFDDIKKKTGAAYQYLFPIPPREVT